MVLIMSIHSILNDYYRDVMFMYPNNIPVGVFLFGSQNYGLEHEKSDVDALVIVCPSWNDVIYAEKPLSRQIDTETGKIQIRDVRLVLRDMAKPHLSAIECLATDYSIINPMFENLWTKLKANTDSIAFANRNVGVSSMVAMAKNIYRSFQTKWRAGEKVSARKLLSRLVFVDSYLNKYLSTDSFKDCLKCSPEVRDDYFYARAGLEDEAILPLGAALLNSIEWYEKTMDHAEINHATLSLLDEMKHRFVKFALGENAYGKI
jgi:hypothetical protein